MTQGGKQRAEKSLLGAAHPNHTGYHPVENVANHRADQRATNAAAEESQQRTNDFAPPVAGNIE